MHDVVGKKKIVDHKKMNIVTPRVKFMCNIIREYSACTYKYNIIPLSWLCDEITAAHTRATTTEKSRKAGEIQ